MQGEETVSDCSQIALEPVGNVMAEENPQETKEEKEKHFSEGINFYKLVWIYAIGSILGFLWETVYCSIRAGAYEWRSGMLHTPFNPVYGFGALMFYLVLYKIKRKNIFGIFVIGVVCGTAVELICSYVQEWLFGTASWNYSKMFLNFQGRICLEISLFWGVLALVWAELARPLLEIMIARIPQKAGKAIAWILFGVIVTDAALTAGAMFRWIERVDGVAAKSVIGKAFDFLFPDARMEFTFPRIRFVR